MSREHFPPDQVERELPDVAAAVEMLGERDPSFLRYVRMRRSAFEQAFGTDHGQCLDKAEKALQLAYARFALRHGSWGGDLHHYHNEDHALEILSDRINYLCEKAGDGQLQPLDWVMLTLFGAMHDLRQREAPNHENMVGSNESASIDEAHRILELAGFDREADEVIFEDLELMIAGSTFNVQPRQNPNIVPAEAAATCGALAPTLVEELNQNNPDWRDDPMLERRVRLTLIASDLDTANVAEPMIKYARSAVRLCKEIEFRCGRDLDTTGSAGAVYGFLTKGQETYFFDLHQFDSPLGNQILGPMKEKNSATVTALTQHIRDTFGEVPGPDLTGRMIVDEFMHKPSELSGRAATM